MAREVKIVSEDGQEGFCMPESVAAWERAGWTVADDGSSEEDSPKSKSAAKKTTSRKAE